MGLLWGCSLLLVAAAFLPGGCSGSSWHSLRYFYTMIWAPDQGEPDFIAVGYLDDQLGGHYNSTTRRAVPRVPWIRNVEKEYPRFWVLNTQRAIDFEWRMKADLLNLKNIYNQSRGLYIWQHMFVCELNKDGSKRGFMQFGYNGEDYLSFDKETLTWTAAVVPAQVTKRQWDADLARCHWYKDYLEKECIGWLKTFLEFGKESLLRREPPVVTVGLRWPGNPPLSGSRLPPQGDRCHLAEGRGCLGARDLSRGRCPQLGRDLPHLAEHQDPPQGQGSVPVPRGTRQPAGASGYGLGGAGVTEAVAHCGGPLGGCGCSLCAWDHPLLLETAKGLRSSQGRPVIDKI